MHSAENISKMVNDVDRYVEFLPWCVNSKVLSRTGDECIASVTLSLKGLKRSFTTRNQLVGYDKTILTLVDGPFSNLSGLWEYLVLGPNTSKISLNLEFDFCNLVMGSIVGPIFKIIADSMVESFCKRADQIYPQSND